MPANIQNPLNKENLFSKIYDDFLNQYSDVDFIDQRAIICPLNKHTDEINEFASNQLPGNYSTYHSIDSIIDDNNGNNHFFNIEYLNNLKISGLPPDELKLKINEPIILIELQRSMQWY